MAYIPKRNPFENVDLALDSSAKNVAIVGRNGCGKSTLLKLLMGELEQAQAPLAVARETLATLKQDPLFP